MIKEIHPKQTDMNLIVFEFLVCVCSSILRRLNWNFSRKIKIPILQIIHPKPFFTMLKSKKKSNNHRMVAAGVFSCVVHILIDKKL